MNLYINEVKAEITEELAADEMEIMSFLDEIRSMEEKLNSELCAFPSEEMDVDMAFAFLPIDEDEPVSLLTDEEKEQLQSLLTNDPDDTLAIAAQALLAANIQETPMMKDDADCGEWLQLHHSFIEGSVHACLKHLSPAGYELEDLVQEANLAIIEKWDAFDETQHTSRKEYCGKAIYGRMRSLIRDSKMPCRDCRLTEPVNAVTLAHYELEDSCFGKAAVWSSLYAETDQFEDIVAAQDSMSKAKTLISGREEQILSLLELGYKQTEIANIIGKSKWTVCRDLKSARTQIREAIA